MPATDAMLCGRDGRVSIPCDDLPLPLLEEDFAALTGSFPDYDAVGRGIYQALRLNPDCAGASRYAALLKDAYPHLLAELATNMAMLQKKDVEVPYIDRLINSLKVFALLEPANSRYPLEIGLTFMEKGLRLSALHLTTASFYKALEFLEKAEALAPADLQIKCQLGEVSYILGRYADAVGFWRDSAGGVAAPEAQRFNGRIAMVDQGTVPLVPAVDYLEAIGAAFAAFQEEAFEDSAAILQDVLADAVFCRDFPIPQIHHILGLCYVRMNMPRFAEHAFNDALELDPDYADARSALAELQK
jgi:tetratricopeptide (TPR) repeat protein